jgi:hypothetical protein
MNDPLLARLKTLPRAEPDPRVSDAVRRRCRAALERRNRRRAPLDPDRSTSFQYAIALISALYLTSVLGEALRLYGLF